MLHYREQGYLPEALLNYLARLGWSHGDQEIFSLGEMVELFDLDHVNKAASAINPDKLAWISQQHLMHAPPARVATELAWQLGQLGVDVAGGPPLEAIVLAQRERAKTLHEMAGNSLYFFRSPEGYDDKAARKRRWRRRCHCWRRRAALAALDWRRRSMRRSKSCGGGGHWSRQVAQRCAWRSRVAACRRRSTRRSRSSGMRPRFAHRPRDGRGGMGAGRGLSTTARRAECVLRRIGQQVQQTVRSAAGIADLLFQLRKQSSSAAPARWRPARGVRAGGRAARR